ncbi:hypothetical protein P4735_15280, partial [Listeria monocytogenes]|nr:hypothetical protein [Listeria monocytogenes]
HHEAVAEAELDIDYANSPIVMGDRHDPVSPGQRLPDQIPIRLAAGGEGMLHDHTNRKGHTVFILGGPRTPREVLDQLRAAVEPL